MKSSHVDTSLTYTPKSLKYRKPKETRELVQHVWMYVRLTFDDSVVAAAVQEDASRRLVTAVNGVALHTTTPPQHTKTAQQSIRWRQRKREKSSNIKIGSITKKRGFLSILIQIRVEERSKSLGTTYQYLFRLNRNQEYARNMYEPLTSSYISLSGEGGWDGCTSPGTPLL